MSKRENKLMDKMSLFKRNKKGQLVTFSSMPSIAITMLVVVLLVAIGAILLNTLRDDTSIVTGNSTAYNITNQGLGFFDNLSAQFPLLGTIIILVLVIVVVIAAFSFRGRGGGL